MDENRYGMKSIVKTLKRHAPFWFEQAPYMPQLIQETLIQQRRAPQVLEQQSREIEALKESFNQYQQLQKKLIMALSTLTLFLLCFLGPLTPFINEPWLWIAITLYFFVLMRLS